MKRKVVGNTKGKLNPQKILNRVCCCCSARFFFSNVMPIFINYWVKNSWKARIINGNLNVFQLKIQNWIPGYFSIEIIRRSQRLGTFKNININIFLLIKIWNGRETQNEFPCICVVRLASWVLVNTLLLLVISRDPVRREEGGARVVERGSSNYLPEHAQQNPLVMSGHEPFHTQQLEDESTGYSFQPVCETETSRFYSTSTRR